MSARTWPEPDHVCPKRTWVLNMLADDEAMDRLTGLPMGLQFHLKQCPACRELAERLQRTSALLAELATEEPPAELLQPAQTQAQVALATGAGLTGRITFEDEPFEDEVRPRLPWRHYVPYLAVAASIVIAASVLRFGSPGSAGPTGQPLVHSGEHTPPALGLDAPALDDATSLLEASAADAGESPPVAGPARVHTPRNYLEAADGSTECSFQRARLAPDPARAGKAWELLFDRPSPPESIMTPED